MEVYVRLKALRKSRGWQQSDLAKILGVTQATISRMERFHNELDENLYKRLVEEIGADEVIKFVGETPLINVLNKKATRRKNEQDDKLTDVEALVLVIADQQKTIERMKKMLEDEREKHKKEIEEVRKKLS